MRRLWKQHISRHSVDSRWNCNRYLLLSVIPWNGQMFKTWISGFSATLTAEYKRARKARPKLKQKPVSVNFLSSKHRFGSLNDKTPVDYQFRSDSGSFGAIFLTGPNPVINILLSPATNFRPSACASTSTNARLINWNKFVQKYLKPLEKEFLFPSKTNDE